jgi:hypothetical protein
MKARLCVTSAMLLWAISLVAQATPPPSGRQTVANPTFEKDVLPIVQRNCQQCHRPGQIGPFSLLDYQSARPWARAIRQSVLARTMPPWHADPGVGHFLNDRSLKPEEIAILVNWADSGAAQGDRADAPAPIKWPEGGWSLPPEAVVDIPTYDVPASGVIEWLYSVVPTGFTEDKWVTSIELLPGAVPVIHHVCVTFVPPNDQVQLGVWRWRDLPRDAEGVVIPQSSVTQDPVNRPPPTGAGGRVITDGQPGAVDGMYCYEPSYTLDNYGKHRAARLLPKGWNLEIQMHYTTNGTPVVDKSRVAFTFADAPPDRRLLKRVASPSIDPKEFFIPPHESNWPGVPVEEVFNVAAELVWLSPHMHTRGKSMTYTLTYPDGRSEVILKVSNYDYRWQNGYETSIQVPKGSKLRIDATYDNSAANKLNPNPNRVVHWGQQTWEEMQGGFYDIVVPKDVDPESVVTRTRNTRIAKSQ